MTITELVSILKSAQNRDRELDFVIALLWGYKQDTADPDKWFEPSGQQRPVPFFTGVLDGALSLIDRNEVDGGFSWENGKASARIGTGKYHEAATPAIAICIAAIYHKFDRPRTIAPSP